MSTTLNNIDNIISSSYTNGVWPIFWSGGLSVTTTAATTTSGYVSAQRYPNPITTPAIPMYLTYARLASGTASTMLVCAKEILLGTLAVSGGVYTPGVANMGTQVVNDASIAVAAQYAVVVITTTLVSTTPTLTITYTNQDHTASRTATLVLPTNAAISSAFLINPHLQSGDTGIYGLHSVIGISISTGTAGQLAVYGLLPLASSSCQTVGCPFTPDPLTVSEIPYQLNNETIGFYRFGINTNSVSWAVLNLVGSD